MPAVALTDHGSLAGAVELYREARQARRQAADRLRGLRRRRPPRAGEGLRAPDAARRDERGLREPDQARPRSATSRATTTSRASTGSCWSGTRPGSSRSPGCLSGRVCKALEENRPAGRRGRARPARAGLRARQRSTSRCRTPGSPCRRGSTRSSPSSRERRGLPLVATGDVHYLLHEDARAHEALLCIQSGDSLKNPNHWKFDTDQFFFKTPGRDGRRLPGSRGRAAAHARGRRALQRRRSSSAGSCCPQFPTPERPRRVRLPRRAVREGPRRSATAQVTPELSERLQFELKTIQRDGLRGLLPDRLGLHPLREAERRSASAPAAARPPARSPPTASRSPTSTRCATGCCSSASSTRPARTCPTWTSTSRSPGRDRVINYVAEKYGRDRVAQIITFGTMAARAAVRDAGPRARDPLRHGRQDREADPRRAGVRRSTSASSRAPSCSRRTTPTRSAKRDRRPRQAARGPRPPGLDPRRRRRDRRPAADRGRAAAAEGRRPGGRDAVRRWATSSTLGLLKMDFLGLRNLDVIDKAVELVGDGLDIERDPARRRARRTRCSRARDSTGVFQFESSGMREALRAGQADRVRGPDRARRALPARADAVHPRLRAAQERPGGGHLHRRAAEADHGRLVRHLHLPGAVHADRQGARRLLARRGRDAAQGDRQEDPRADGVPQGEVPRGLRGERRHARPSRSSSGRTWSSRRTTPSTRRTPPATR